MTNGEAAQKMAELFGRSKDGIAGMYINGIQVFDGKNWNSPIEISMTRYVDSDKELTFGRSGTQLYKFKFNVLAHESPVFVKDDSTGKLINIYKDKEGVEAIPQNGVGNDIGLGEFTFYCELDRVEVKTEDGRVLYISSSEAVK